MSIYIIDNRQLLVSPFMPRVDAVVPQQSLHLENFERKGEPARLLKATRNV